MENENQTDLEEVINEVENETPQVEEVAQEQPELDLEKFDSKDNPDIIKVDLDTPTTNETEESNSNDTGVVGVDESAKPAQEQEEVQPQGEAQGEVPVLEEITEEAQALAERAEEAISQAEQTGQDLPENVQKLVDFINDTGGDLEDYVKLNRDISQLDDQDALREYYKETKPHLSAEEVDFLMEDQFAYDEDADNERDIKRRKLARKEQVAEAKAYLDGQKSKYYEDIKAGSKLTEDQQKAVDFFNRYNKDQKQRQEITEKQVSRFNKKTNDVFNDEFKGFEYNVGDKRYRFNVNNADQVKESQSDINNFVKKFLNEENTLEDAAGYHKSLYTAMHADAIAQHFYEQGKADAIKDGVAKAKNINTMSRSSHNEPMDNSGYKVRVLGDNADSFKFKIKSKNKN